MAIRGCERAGRDCPAAARARGRRVRDRRCAARDPALAEVFGTQLPELVVATDRDRAAGGMPVDGSGGIGGRAEQIRDLLAPPAVIAHGPGLARAWASMISALDRWVYVPRSGRDYDAIVTTFKDHVRAVSDELAAANLGYYLEGDIVLTGAYAHAIVYAYRVEDVALVYADGRPRRVLGLRRLDDLSIEHAMMGMQSEDLGDPVLLLDQIDTHVLHTLLPTLTGMSDYPLGDPSWDASEAGAKLSATAATAVRGELTAMLPLRVLSSLVAASVRRHEAQHGLDADRETRLPYPDALARLIGDANDRFGQPRNFADHCRNELSAYTSQIANDPVTPKTAYFQLAHFAFARHTWGTPESYAAVVVSEGLARNLGAPVAPVIHDGQIDRDRLATAATTIARAAPDALRAAARATWHDLYAEDITTISDR